MSYEFGTSNIITMSFDNGVTWYNVSDYVKYDTMNISIRAMNEEFRMAQNEATFDIIYEPTLYNFLITAQQDFLVQISHRDEISGNRLGMFNLGNGRLQSISVYPIFTGHASYGISRSYNGIIDNTIIQITATDSGDLLDVPCGDIVYRSTATQTYKICDPTNINYSIVHQLVNIAGFNASAKVDPTLVIDFEYPENTAFAPTSEDDSVKELLDTLLHEFGYVLYFNELDNLSAMPWIRDSSYPISHTFTDSDTQVGLNERRNVKQYEGLELTYYEMGLGVTTSADNKTIVFRDSKMEYNQTEGGFFGYNIFPGKKYPIETNVIDDATGDWQQVFQEYTSDGISYFTNKAVVNGLDYNRNAFQSDFTSIVATFDHEIVISAEAGIEYLQPPVFYNKKAEVIFINNTADYKRIKYFNIFANMIYKTGKRKCKSSGNALDRKLYKYEAKFIFTKEVAQAYVQKRTAQFLEANSIYSFESLDRYDLGTSVGIVLDDGTNVVGILMSRSLNNSTGKWYYVVKTYSVNNATLTSQKVSSLSTPTQTQPVEQSYNAQNLENLSGTLEGDLKQVSSDGSIRFYKYTSGSWVEIGGFSADNIRFDTDDASLGLGYNVMEYSSTAKSCITIGNNAGRYKTSGDFCTFIGESAGAGTSTTANTAAYNVGIGYNAMKLASSGEYNVSIGTESLYQAAAVVDTVAIGYRCGYSQSNGGYNVLIGRSCGYNITSGSNNVAIGSQTLFNMTSGGGNVGLGFQVGGGISTSVFSTLIGYQAGFNAAGSYNTGVGKHTLRYATSGDYNIAIGESAGMWTNAANNLTSTSGSIYIGYLTTANAVGQSNQIVIGHDARGFGTNTATIGNTSITQFRVAGGNVTVFSGPSDPRLKEDIKDANLSVCYANIKALPLKRFKFKDFVFENRQDVHITGFLSPDIKKIFPKSVTTLTQEFPVLDSNGNRVTKVIKEELHDGTTVEKEIVETFTIEDVENVTLNELQPQLVGAVQYLMKDVEDSKTLYTTQVQELQSTITLQNNQIVEQTEQISTMQSQIAELVTLVQTLQASIDNS